LSKAVGWLVGRDDGKITTRLVEVILLAVTGVTETDNDGLTLARLDDNCCPKVPPLAVDDTIEFNNDDESPVVWIS